MYLSSVGDRDGDGIFSAMAADNKLPGTEVHVSSLPTDDGGFTHIEYRSYEGIVTRGIIRAARATAREGFDAMAIGCFYDTGLHKAREVSGEMIVTAPCVASCEIAASLSNRFGIIVGRRKWVHQMQATVHENGHRDRLPGFYHVELGVNDFQTDHQLTRSKLNEAGRKAVNEDFAESVILGCTLEVGFHEELQAELGVPVIDPSIAALKRAEYAAVLKTQCGWKPSRKWSCEAPPEHEIETFGGFNDGEAFGNRIIIPATTAAEISPQT